MTKELLRVAVVGAGGRLGALACDVFERAPDIELVARYGSGDDWPQQVQRSEACVALEATRAGLGFEHARALLERGVRPLVGTSGVDREASSKLDALARARGLGGLVVPNFSLGALLMMRFAELAARSFPSVEIVEGHRPEKRDAPSGTSLETAARITRSRGAGEVPIHSLRLPGLYAEQDVIFGGDGEQLRISHAMHGPQAFSAGLLAGVRWAAAATGVGHGLECAVPPEGP